MDQPNSRCWIPVQAGEGVNQYPLMDLKGRNSDESLLLLCWERNLADLDLGEIWEYLGIPPRPQGPISGWIQPPVPF